MARSFDPDVSPSRAFGPTAMMPVPVVMLLSALYPRAVSLLAVVQLVVAMASAPTAVYRAGGGSNIVVYVTLAPHRIVTNGRVVTEDSVSERTGTDGDAVADPHRITHRVLADCGVARAGRLSPHCVTPIAVLKPPVVTWAIESQPMPVFSTPVMPPEANAPPEFVPTKVAESSSFVYFYRRLIRLA